MTEGTVRQGGSMSPIEGWQLNRFFRRALSTTRCTLQNSRLTIIVWWRTWFIIVVRSHWNQLDSYWDSRHAYYLCTPRSTAPVTPCEWRQLQVIAVFPEVPVWLSGAPFAYHGSGIITRCGLPWLRDVGMEDCNESELRITTTWRLLISQVCHARHHTDSVSSQTVPADCTQCPLQFSKTNSCLLISAICWLCEYHIFPILLAELCHLSFCAFFCFVPSIQHLYLYANSDQCLLWTQGSEQESDFINPILHLQSLISELGVGCSTVFQQYGNSKNDGFSKLCCSR